jgi:heme A synthase
MTPNIFTIGLFFIYLFVYIVLDVFILRKKVNRLQRGILSGVALFGGLLLMLSILGVFSYITNWSTLFIVIFAVLCGSILIGVINYFSLVFNDWRIRRLRKKLSQLPDGPLKKRLEIKLDTLESAESKKLHKNNS